MSEGEVILSSTKKGRKSKFWDIKEFEKESSIKHGDKFDYSKVILSGSNNKVIIVCPIHGEFTQTPNGHLKYGCYDCNPRKKKTTEDFIREAREFHGDKFDYSLVEYVRSDKKVQIICPVHGVFQQKPSNHLFYDCARCKYDEKVLSNEKFIEKCVEVHGGVYDYSLVEYKGIKEDVTIICRKHGEFKQEARVHQSGYHCQKCSNENNSNLKTKTTIQFIESARKVHGDTYSYEKVCYTHSYNNVEITCTKHGIFTQKAKDHLSGSGCQVCAEEIRGELLRKDTQYFIEKSKLTHSDNYDYSLTEYTSAKDAVKIICKHHGVFEQKPSDHYVSGCPKCGWIDTYSKSKYVSNANNRHRGLSNLYFIEVFDDVERFYKIGISVYGLDDRFSTSKMLPYDYHELLVMSLPAETAWVLETHLHKMFGKFLYKPLCDFGGSFKECFKLTSSQEMNVVFEIYSWLSNFKINK